MKIVLGFAGVGVTDLPQDVSVEGGVGIRLKGAKEWERVRDRKPGM